MAKSKTKKYPPAFKRYREAHPTISVVLTQETKVALNAARGDLSYAEYIKSLFTPDGAFSRLKQEQDTLNRERTALDTEKKSWALQYNKKKQDLENERKKLISEYSKKNETLENERDNLAREYDEKYRAFEDEKQKLIAYYNRKIQTLDKENRKLILNEHFFVPCNHCNGSIIFDSTQANWDTEIKPKLLYAFRGYYHKVCPR